MRPLAHLTAVTGLALLAASCGEETLFDPISRVDELDGLTLEAEFTKESIAIGDSAIVTIRLRNHRNEARTLTFGSGCQIMPFVRTVLGAPAYPAGGWACTANITTLDVPALGTVVRTVIVRGVGNPNPMSPAISLQAGAYRFHARLEPFRDGGSLHSRDVAFEVH